MDAKLRPAARVAVQHDGRYDLTGFYIGVSGSSFYYDMPVTEAEAQDSSDVFYINIEIPESDNVEYPFSMPIKILPHGPDGLPLDEFDKELTSEDPGKALFSPITTPAGQAEREPIRTGHPRFCSRCTTLLPVFPVPPSTRVFFSELFCASIVIYFLFKIKS